MKWKQWAILLLLPLLLLSIVVACLNLGSNNRTRGGASGVADVTPEVLFEQGKSYQVKPLNECDTTLQLFDFEYDSATGKIIRQFTVPPGSFCQLEKPFTVIGEPQIGLVPKLGIGGVLGQLKPVRFLRIRWETEVAGFYQEAFVEEIRAYKDSKPVEGQ